MPDTHARTQVRQARHLQLASHLKDGGLRLPIQHAQRLVRRQPQVRRLAVLQEPASHGQDLRRGERDVESLGDWVAAGEQVEEGLVAGLDGEDAAGSGEDGGVGEEGGLLGLSQYRAREGEDED